MHALPSLSVLDFSLREVVPTGMLFNMADRFYPAAPFISRETEKTAWRCLTITFANSYFEQDTNNTENSLLIL